MRNLMSSLFCLVFTAQTVLSQLTLTPRIGFENSRTLVSVSDSKFFSPIPSQFTPQAGIRLDYKFKKGHGVFAGFSTSNTATGFNFSNPETSLINYFSSRSTTRVRLEGGYQFNTKPVFFRSSSSSKKTRAQKNIGCSKSKENSMKRSCGNYSRSSSSHCGKTKNAMAKHKAKNEMMFFRLQPQIGIAYNPDVKNDFEVKAQNYPTTYSYNAGNWRTAMIAGMGFEFGKGKTGLFRVNLQYLKGIGNLSNTILTTQSGNKSVETGYSSRASSWSLTFGVPVSFAKKPAAKNKTQQKNNCEQIRYRCSSMRRI